MSSRKKETMAEDEVNPLGSGDQGEIYNLVREGEDNILRITTEGVNLAN